MLTVRTLLRGVVLGAVCLASQAASAWHVRLTETSITETGRWHHARLVPLVTKGYGLHYLFDFGLGLGLTQLRTSGDQQGSSLTLDHSYIDLSYNAGSDWLASFGMSALVSGEARLADEAAEPAQGHSYVLGVGYRWRWAEILWLNRRNYVIAGARRLTSTHYQLGLGVVIE